jgi:NADPH-dependent curcumin reductase CurA
MLQSERERLSELNNMNDTEYEVEQKIKKCQMIKLYIENVTDNEVTAIINSCEDKELIDFCGFIKNEKIALRIEEGVLYDFYGKRFVIVYGKERDLL